MELYYIPKIKVWKAIDKRCKNTCVALKKIFDAF
jgi:hypothetical protein